MYIYIYIYSYSGATRMHSGSHGDPFCGLFGFVVFCCTLCFFQDRYLVPGTWYHVQDRTNTQSVALTLLFFKLNWFESNWIREVKIPLEKKFPGISKIWLLGHVPSFFLGLIDAWSTDPRLIKTYGADLRTIVRFAFCYGAAYLCWAKFWQFYTGGTCIYPFVKDLNSALKCLGFVLVVGVAVSAMAFGVHQISLLTNREP